MNKVVTFKTDAQTKEAAQMFAKESGLTLSSFINICIKQALREGRLDIRLPDRMTPKLEQMLGKIDADIKAGRNLSKPHTNIESFLKDLQSDDSSVS